MWWYVTAMCLVLCLFLDTLANFPAHPLSSNGVHLICKLVSGIFRIGFNSKINSMRGSKFRADVGSTVYSTLIVETSISDWSLLNHGIGYPSNSITHPGLDLTELGSSQVSFVSLSTESVSTYHSNSDRSPVGLNIKYVSLISIMYLPICVYSSSVRFTWIALKLCALVYRVFFVRYNTPS